MKHLITLTIFITLLTISGCKKDDDPNPQPPIPNYIGYWHFQSGTLIRADNTVHTTSTFECTQTNPDYPIFSVDFNVTTTTTAIQKSGCGLADAPLTYTTTVVNNILTEISFKDSGVQSFKFVNIIVNETDKTITGDLVVGIGKAKSMAWVFHLN